jgi:hypothetical protein
MYLNTKRRPVETVQGIREGECMREVEEGESSMIYCKNLCKCYNVPTPNTTIKKIHFAPFMRT